MSSQTQFPVKASAILAAFQSQGLLSELRGDDREVTGVAPADQCGGGDLTFAANKDYLAGIRKNKPAVVVTSAELADQLSGDGLTVLVAPNVELAHAKLKQAYGDRDYTASGWGRVHPSAVIHESVNVPETAIVEPLAVIGANVQLGEGCVIMARAVVEHGAKIGARTVIHPGVYIGYDCEVGDDCIIKPNAVIGGEGFGFAQDEKRRNHRIPQTGKVVIGDRVVIGAVNTIDRAAYGQTVIGNGCIFDTHNHIAHNCVMGEDCIVVAMTGVAGSTTIGDRVIFSGQTGVLDHIKVPGDSVFLHRAGITQTIDEPGVYAFHPIMPITDYMKMAVSLRQLNDLRKRLKQVEKQQQD